MAKTKKKPPKLTPKQERFAAEYVIDLNGTQAAIRAGYSAKTAAIQAHHLLRHPLVSELIRQRKQSQLEVAGMTAARVMEEIRRLAFCDVRSFFDDSGNLKPMSELSDDQGAQLASFEIIKKNAEAGDGVIDTVHKIRVWDKTRVLELAMKHFGLLAEKVDHTGEIQFKWQDKPA